MKKMAQTVVTVLLLVVMTMAMTVFAFAEGSETNKLSVNNANGNTYSVYQIMTGTKLGDNLYSYSLNADFAGFFEDGANGYTITQNNEIQKDGRNITGDARWANTNTSDTAALASALEKYAVENSITAKATLTDSSEVTLPAGYYVIAETKSSETDNTEVASKPILVNLVGGDAMNITPKNDTTTLEKNILEGDKKVKANTAKIGDKIPYEISTKVPTYEANVDKTALSFVLTDTFSDGLTYNNDLELKIGDAEVTTGFTAKQNGQVLTITLDQDTIFNNQGKSVVATYSATLNEKAKVYDANPNDVKLDYANNTNVTGSHKTLTDQTNTYSFGFGIEKVDKATDEKLDGAVFTLKDKDGNEIKLVKENDTVYRVAKDVDTDTTSDIEVKSKTSGAPTIKGLDEGTYTLVEKTAPDTYSKVSDITVTVTAVKGDDGLPTGAAEISVSGGTTTLEKGSDVMENQTVTNEKDGQISINIYVKDTKGISLPETGSRTAMYFLVFGAAFVAAGVLIFGFSSRKKHESK